MGIFATIVRRIPKRTSAFVAMIAAAIIVPAVLFAWGPDRPTYTIEHPADHVTFNSITNNPNIGDERNFVGIREQGSTGTWKDSITAEPGKSYVVRMYVHNNAADNLNLVAKDVTAKFNLPTNTAKSLQVNGFLSASNASPKEVYDHATFTSAQDFNLAYQANTLKYENNHFGSNGVAINESAFTSTGALLGYDKLDGKIPGCFQYAGYLTFVVKPQFATPKTDFTVKKEVRKNGTGTFGENVEAKPGDKLNYRIAYTNTGDSQQKNVTLKDTLPKGITNVPGTVKIMNAANPNGAVVQNGDKLFSTGINIGAYTGGSNALVVFDATVDPNDKLPTCGNNILKNVASAQPEGQNPKDDDATTTVPKECQPPKVPEYKCDQLTVAKISRTQFMFNTTYTVKNATYKSTTYVIRDEAGKEISRTTNPNYTQTTPGKYTVQAIITVTVDGVEKTATSDNCKKPFEVTEVPATPEYSCDSLSKNKISRTEYKFTGKASASKGAEIVNYTFNFGDGNQKTTDGAVDVAHTYTKAGSYTITFTANIKVNNETKAVTSAACKTQVTISPEECKPGIPVGDERCEEKPPVEECKPGIPVGDERCEEKPPVQECKPGIPMGDERCEEQKEYCTVPGKEHLPKNSADCVETPTTPETPAELPKTGVSDTIGAFIGAGSLVAALGYYIASRRAN